MAMIVVMRLNIYIEVYYIAHVIPLSDQLSSHDHVTSASSNQKSHLKQKTTKHNYSVSCRHGQTLTSSSMKTAPSKNGSLLTPCMYADKQAARAFANVINTKLFAMLHLKRTGVQVPSAICANLMKVIAHFFHSLGRSWGLLNNSKHNEAGFLTISTDSLCLRVVQVRRC
jgi:hypothetical protein